MIEVLFWIAVGTIAYVYAGYPLLLALVTLVRGRRAVRVGNACPGVTLIVSAYNEEAVIAEKIENCLALDYPPERLQVLVISDCSDDRTDAIVQGYAARGVTLLRMQERGGKTLGLNAGVAAARGEAVVFSDANAMFDAGALRAIVANFADATVGAVTGESRYRSGAAERAAESEGLYWRYELALKRLESAVGSLVGGDGAIYAIRKSLYRPMKAADLSDFVNPLQIVAQGYRNVYEPRAVSFEHAGDSFAKEYRRKVRIVNRAWRALMSMPHLMNPLRHGWFAAQVISHKLLRWLVPLFMIVAFAANVALALMGGWFYRTLLAAQLLFYALALAGRLLARRGEPPRIVAIPWYFVMVNVASLRGIWDAFAGKTYTTWTTVREKAAA